MLEITMVSNATLSRVCEFCARITSILYQLHDLRKYELANVIAIESGAVRAAREAKDQKIIRAFGITGHASAGLMVECIKRFDPDTVLTFFLATRPDNGRYENELLPLARSRKIGVI